MDLPNTKQSWPTHSAVQDCSNVIVQVDLLEIVRCNFFESFSRQNFMHILNTLSLKVTFHIQLLQFFVDIQGSNTADEGKSMLYWEKIQQLWTI